jgi:hypothetical protein
MSERTKRSPRRPIIGANWEAQRPRRGRPFATRPRKATRVYLTPQQREQWLDLSEALGTLSAARIDVADLAISHLDLALNEIQRGLTGSGQVLPVGVVDLKSLYFLLDLRPPNGTTKQYNITMLTETREKMSIMTVRLQSVFHATWSQVFGLSITLLHQRLGSRRNRLNLSYEFDSYEALRNSVLQAQQLAFGME